jgi:hypothetical protein
MSSTSAESGPIQKKRVVIGFPGNHFSDRFLVSWTATIVELLKGGEYDVLLSPGYSSFVTFARMKTLGLDVMRGVDQKPFNDLPYDIFMSIDSDMVFGPGEVLALLKATEEYPVVSGLYMMADNKHFATVKDWDTEYFLKNGSFQFMTQEMLAKSGPRISVSYVGMGFFACRAEVLNSLQYPYFYHPLIEIKGEDGKIYRDQVSEDVALCRNIQTAGFDITLCTNIRVGHEKSVVL